MPGIRAVLFGRDGTITEDVPDHGVRRRRGAARAVLVPNEVTLFAEIDEAPVVAPTLTSAVRTALEAA